MVLKLVEHIFHTLIQTIFFIVVKHALLVEEAFPILIRKICFPRRYPRISFRVRSRIFVDLESKFSNSLISHQGNHDDHDRDGIWISDVN